MTANGIVRLFFSSPDPETVKPAVFLDRDGVINEKIPDSYVTTWRSFRFIPGMKDAIKSFSSLALPIIVVSNQAGVGKGMMTVDALIGITRRFVAEVQRQGARVDAVYYCPHTRESNCDCRKPKTGLLECATRDWRLDLDGSVLVGDSPTDIAAAEAAGCRAITFRPGAPAIAGVAGTPQDLSRKVAELLTRPNRAKISRRR